jgi:hypothetical protein
MNEITMQNINPPERSRTYTFPAGEKVTLTDVKAVGVRPSGTHRLATVDGKLHIIPAGWIHVEIDADGWTF